MIPSTKNYTSQKFVMLRHAIMHFIMLFLMLYRPSSWQHFYESLPTADEIAQFMCLLIFVVATNGYCYKIFALVLIALMSLFVYIKLSADVICFFLMRDFYGRCHCVGFGWWVLKSIYSHITAINQSIIICKRIHYFEFFSRHLENV